MIDNSTLALIDMLQLAMTVLVLCAIFRMTLYVKYLVDRIGTYKVLKHRRNRLQGR